MFVDNRDLIIMNDISMLPRFKLLLAHIANITYNKNCLTIQYNDRQKTVVDINNVQTFLINLWKPNDKEIHSAVAFVKNKLN